MFDRIIRGALENRLFVIAAALLALGYGAFVLSGLPVDVFPDLNRPTVTVMVEAGGLSPEEVETQVTLPIEVALNGAPGVRRVRSSSGVGLAVIYVEFDWGSEITLDRQLVAERLQIARERLPRNVVPVMAPISSIMGEILLLGLTSDGAKTSALDLRALADWTVRQRLLTVPGIAQVTVMGGGVKQHQVLVDPRKLLAYGLSLAEVEQAAALSQKNTTGGFLPQKGKEYLVRNLARSSSVADLAGTVVAVRDGVPLLLRHVAEVKEGPGIKRGDGGMNGEPAVILAIQKQPGANTLTLTRAVEQTLEDLSRALPDDVKIRTLFKQSTFIEAAVHNVRDALRDGAILVVVVLSLFLLSLRTTAITLTAIPLSFLITALVMKAAGISVNTMTLGGLAVAIGELVDDAIVDVENVYRRLKENRHLPRPLPPLTVIYRASSEVRNSIVFATAIVVLVFVPLFALDGVEGRLFAPLGVAYIVSILASLLVSLTVTPVLCSFLLPRATLGAHGDDSFLVRFLKNQDRKLLAWVLARPRSVLGVAAAMVVAACASVPFLGKEFMPPFNEGTATLSLFAKPGTSLEESNRIGQAAEVLIAQVPEVESVGRRTGRAEQDEHAEGVHSSEIDVDFKPGGRERSVVLGEIRSRLSQLPGVAVNLGQPISHRLDHLLSGVRAQVAVKVFGNDLETLREQARAIERAIASVPGLVDLQVEQQTLIPQVNIRVRRDEAARLGVRPGELAEWLEGALSGKVVGQVVEGTRSFDVVVRFEESSRSDLESLRRALVDTPGGAKVPLGSLADVSEGMGPNLINHDGIQRRIVVLANTAGRDLGSVVTDVRSRIDGLHLAGTHITLEGQFESQQRATRLIALLSILSLLGMVLLLQAHFRSARLVLQILLNVPLSMVGSVAAVWLTGGVFSVATLVGFITLCGIASRNTIMMISHYLHLAEEEGETFGRALIVRGSLERLVPVLMTALTAGLALLPLVMAKGEPGKEILYPVATVILGGLLSSTLLDMAVTPAAFLLFGEKAVAVWRRERGAALDEEQSDEENPDATHPGEPAVRGVSSEGAR
jgi:CzcA family heavy metal efflux pump